MTWLPLSQIRPAVPLMARLGVSRVARSRRGFLSAYEAAGGVPSRMGRTPAATPGRRPYDWRRRRAEFISRHMAQVRARGEALWTPDGQPTRRHLALVAWAYTPTPARWRRWVRSLR